MHDCECQAIDVVVWTAVHLPTSRTARPPLSAPPANLALDTTSTVNHAASEPLSLPLNRPTNKSLRSARDVIVVLQAPHQRFSFVNRSNPVFVGSSGEPTVPHRVSAHAKCTGRNSQPLNYRELLHRLGALVTDAERRQGLSVCASAGSVHLHRHLYHCVLSGTLPLLGRLKIPWSLTRRERGSLQ